MQLRGPAHGSNCLGDHYHSTQCCEMEFASRAARQLAFAPGSSPTWHNLTLSTSLPLPAQAPAKADRSSLSTTQILSEDFLHMTSVSRSQGQFKRRVCVDDVITGQEFTHIANLPAPWLVDQVCVARARARTHTHTHTHGDPAPPPKHTHIIAAIASAFKIATVFFVG